MQIKDVPESALLQLATRKNLFFDPKTNQPIIIPNSRGKKRQPKTKKFESVLNTNDELFINFLEKCLEWNPISRITPLEALQHPWILSGLPQKVLEHHQQMF
jgi:dual specificity tyrosine-phosphorylation-regulated kinase 2/3/4